jgi:hypothetical protein
MKKINSIPTICVTLVRDFFIKKLKYIFLKNIYIVKKYFFKMKKRNL